MEIEFYPYDFEYQVDGGMTYFYFFAKQGNGQKIVVKHLYQPYFYVSLEGVDISLLTQKLKGLVVDSAAVTAWEEVEKELVGKKKQFYKVFVNYPKAVPVISKKLQSWGVECYETDILFVHRYLRDHALLPMSLITAQGAFVDEHEFKVPLFVAESVAQKDTTTKEEWKILAVDIETYSVRKEIDARANPILMIALRGKDYQKVITWKKFSHDLDYLEIVADETAMLERFKEIILEHQPDILTGYFSDGFDLPYIKTRAEKHNVRLNLGVDDSELVVVSKTGSRSGQKSPQPS